ncbi:MAG: hypothetical protein PF501_14755 [Salinisphaera sp.]|jgi:hypothetical protein|nr:hypothetical protein [Salinisphaera sp.]
MRSISSITESYGAQALTLTVYERGEHRPVATLTRHEPGAMPNSGRVVEEIDSPAVLDAIGRTLESSGHPRRACTFYAASLSLYAAMDAWMESRERSERVAAIAAEVVQ